MPPTLMGHRTTRPPIVSRVGRLVALLLLGVAVVTGAVAAGSSPAWAQPTPTPVTTGSPDGSPPTTPVPPTPAAPSESITPAPTDGGTAPGWTAPSDDGSDDPGLFDIPGQIRKAINDVILWIAQTGLTPVLNTLGHTVLSTPDLTANAQVQTFWTTSLVTANGIFVLFVIAGGFIVASRETLQTSYGLKEIAPRVAVAGVAANLSLLLAGKAIDFTNALTAAIAGQGVDGQAASTAIEQILTQPASNLAIPPILLSLLVLAALVMAIVVVMTFVLRIALLVVLLGVAPLALMCHATPQTEGLAYAWWRAFAACLGIQLGQAVILLAAIRVFLTPAGPEISGVPGTTDGLLGVLACLTMLWLLIKLPGWTRHLILGPLARQGGRGLLGQIIHAAIMVRTLGALAGDGGRPARFRGSAGSARPGSGPSPTGGPSPSGGPIPVAGGPRPGPGPAQSRPARARPASGRPASGRPGRSRPVPAPVGPAAFSHAPASHTPPPRPAASVSAPVFSSPTRPDTPGRPPAVPATPVGFSHRPGSTAATPATGARPAAPRFSRAPTPTTPTRRSAAVPAATFSAAPHPQAAPKRPPAPATPPFSSPTSAPAGGTTPARPARSRTAVPSPVVPSARSSASVVPPARSSARRSRDRGPREGRPQPGGES